MVIQTLNSTKKAKTAQASSSVSKRNNLRGKHLVMKNASDRKDENASVVSDIDPQDISISPRQNEFSESTWWMVDIEHNGEEGANFKNSQGATAIVKRCMRVHGWTQEKSRRILTAYRQFLTLKKEHEDWDATGLSPSLLVDQMWHQHILDVTNYCHDMMLLCGRVVGHNPDGAGEGSRLSGKVERDKATRKALKQRFPQYDKEIWGVMGRGTSSEARRQRNEAVPGSGSENESRKEITFNLKDLKGAVSGGTFSEVRRQSNDEVPGTGSGRGNESRGKITFMKAA